MANVTPLPSSLISIELLGGSFLNTGTAGASGVIGASGTVTQAVTALAGMGITAGTLTTTGYRPWTAYGSLANQKPTGAQVLFDIAVADTITVGAGMPGGNGGWEIAPAGTVSQPLFKNGSSVMALITQPGSTAGVWSGGPATWGPGDRMQFKAPGTIDNNATGPYWAVRGTF